MDNLDQRLAEELVITCEEQLKAAHTALRAKPFEPQRIYYGLRSANMRYRRIAKLCLQHFHELKEGKTPTYPELNSILEKIAWDLYSEILSTPL